MDVELYKQYRPKKLAEVIGQERAVKVLTTHLESNSLPHSILLSGPSGCGKTTIARILKTHLECGDGDWHELNCADFRGIDMVRDIRTRLNLLPMFGKVRIWLIDECHQLTKDAQNGLLKMLEDTPRHVFFILATTDPSKLLKTIQTRCTSITVGLLNPKQVEALLLSVIKKHGKGKLKVDECVIDKIAQICEGSARKALVLLGTVVGIDNADDQMEALEKGDTTKQVIDIARTLLNPKTRWQDMALLLKGVGDEPEQIRRMVLGYMSNVLLGGKMAARAFLIIQCFRDHWYDSGRAGLIASCYEVVTSK